MVVASKDPSARRPCRPGINLVPTSTALLNRLVLDSMFSSIMMSQKSPLTGNYTATMEILHRWPLRQGSCEKLW